MSSGVEIQYNSPFIVERLVSSGWCGSSYIITKSNELTSVLIYVHVFVIVVHCVYHSGNYSHAYIFFHIQTYTVHLIQYH